MTSRQWLAWFLFSTGAAFCIAATSAAQGELFRDQMNNGATWGINQSPDLDSLATFNFNYSTVGIPEAPHTRIGDVATRGVKLEANNGDGNAAAAFFTLYPIGQNFTGSYWLRFDA